MELKRGSSSQIRAQDRHAEAASVRDLISSFKAGAKVVKKMVGQTRAPHSLELSEAG